MKKILVLAALAAVLFGQTTHKATEGVYTKEQSEAGKASYGAKCAVCHGDTLGGGDVPPALVGGTFMSSWSGQPVFDLFDRIRTGMPPGKEGSLSRADTAAITAYILDQNGYPASQTALDTRDEILKTIIVDPKN
jgi:mono/diheme cytochrome c family protein